MSRCIELAQNGLGKVAPNPLVGAVIVQDNKIIAEGFHQSFGEAHAEVNAVGNALSRHPEQCFWDCTLYVNLEPCSHHGKTPPCADLIISHKFKKVVIGCEDPFEKVRGTGIRSLRNSGIEVVVNVMQKKSLELNRRFITFHEKKRPYIVLKFAKSKDNFIAAVIPAAENRWITNVYSRKLVHRWRSEEQAIMVGYNTALIDNPALTLREWPGKQPLRLVIDQKLSLPNNLNLLDRSVPTLLYNELKSETQNNLEYVQLDFGNKWISQICADLYKRSIQSVIIEGGQKLLQQFIEEKCWDEARIFTGAKTLTKGLKAPELKAEQISTQNIADDLLEIYRPIN